MSRRCTFDRAFSPLEGFVKACEREHRRELCLNGYWDFQPQAVPADYVRDRGVPPEMTPPSPGGWEATPIKVPSPWNVNTWGNGRRNIGPDHPSRPYAPDSEYYPSYPLAWDDVEMAWYRKTVVIPSEWCDCSTRLLLHFEAVAGACRVLFNGREVAENFDKYLPFTVDVTEAALAGENELLVAVQSHRLFNDHDPRYLHCHAPYPNGSYTHHLAGIWQDVYLVAVADVYVEDVFAKPFVGRDRLELAVTLRNASDRPRTVSLAGDVREYISRAGTDILSAPEGDYALGETALTLPETPVTIEAGASVTVTCGVTVVGRLKHWSPDAPNLYGAVVSVEEDGRTRDAKYQRFGWREFRIEGDALTLNGEKIQLVGDLIHPFGVFTQSRRFAYAWCRMIKDCGGNAFRPHAQPYPSYFLDVADEMGLVVLDETAVFGSSIQLNFNEAFWPRFRDHYIRLIRRDRSHPSVYAWSFGNELFAVFRLNNIPPAEARVLYDRLYAVGRLAGEYDDTREIVTADGDEDFDGRLPVWSKHFGHGDFVDALPRDKQKPLIVNESGGTYYARPEQLTVFAGERAYESYRGRNEALGIDAYRNLVNMAKPHLASFSLAELVWFGLRSVPFGYRDSSRFPTREDGVFFAPFREGVPGMQPERLPPFVSTLNPGFDPAYPLYEPLGLFYAHRAAMAGHVCPYKPRRENDGVPCAAVPRFERVGFVGAAGGRLWEKLGALGVKTVSVTLTEELSAVGFVVVDNGTLREHDARLIEAAEKAGVTLLWVIDTPSADLTLLNRVAPTPLRLTARTATQLEKPDVEHIETAALRTRDLYFAEEDAPADRVIMNAELAGDLSPDEVLLRASNTNWALFNNIPEDAKVPAVQIYEQLQKPCGNALVCLRGAHAPLYVTTIRYAPDTRHNDALWQALLAGCGVVMGVPRSKTYTTAAHAHDLLLNGPEDQGGGV